MKKITTRQVIIFYCLYSFSIKFLALPSLLSVHAGRDAWIAAAIGTVLELAMIFLVLNVLVAGRNSDIYSDMRRNTTMVGAKAFILMMLAVLLLQIFILAAQSYNLLNEHLFDEVNIHKFLVPLMLMGILFCFMPARAIFRSGEVYWLLIIVALVLAVGPALMQVRPAEATPVLSRGVNPVFNAIFRNLIYFESAALLLVFSGDIKIEKDFRKKFMTAATLVGVFFVLFVLMCTMLFGPLAPLKSTAIAGVTIYSSFLTQGGRLDWLLICVWLLLLLLRFGVAFFCAFASLRYVFNLKHRAGYIGFGIATVVYPLFVWVFKGADGVNDFVGLFGIAIAVAILFFLIPILSFLNSLIPLSKKQIEKVKSKLPPSEVKEGKND